MKVGLGDGLLLKEPQIPCDGFGRAGTYCRKIRMFRIEHHIELAALGDDTGHAQYGGSAGANPCIAKCARCRLIFRIPIGNPICDHGFNSNGCRNLDANDTMMFRRTGEVRVDEDFKKGARICFACVDDTEPRGVPTTAVEHGASGIEDGMTGVGDAIGDNPGTPVQCLDAAT